jgi:alpha/beta superfamily hydrolase
MIEPLSLLTGDGVTLEAELSVPEEPWAAAVLTHPHPMHGGNMRSIVPGALFAALPPAGVAALRFNFRGVEGSQGRYDHGRGERLDVVAAIDTLSSITEGLPLLLAGWSFGADVALTVDDERLSGWLAVAPPLRTVDSDGSVRPAGWAASRDPRPTVLVVPEHDQFRDATSARQVTRDWVATRIEVVPGADHFLVGRTDRVVELAIGFLRELAGVSA